MFISAGASVPGVIWKTISTPSTVIFWPVAVTMSVGIMSVAVPVDVVDARGRAVVVDGRCQPTAEPAGLRGGGRPRRIVSWAGPWPVDERWWDPERCSRRVRFQVVTDDGVRLAIVPGALDGSGLRHLRPGQRVTCTRTDDGVDDVHVHGISG